MKIIITILSLILMYTSVSGGELKNIPGKVISLVSLKEMFQNIKNSTEWDMSRDMLWGYYFTHNEPKKLEIAAKLLNKQGYKVVGISLSEKEDQNEPDMFWLHVEKIETHTPISLDKRNNELYIFAHQQNLDSYDGMDVGPASK